MKESRVDYIKETALGWLGVLCISGVIPGFVIALVESL